MAEENFITLQIIMSATQREEVALTFLVPEEQGLLCRVWPLEGSVIIEIHAAGHIRRRALHHRHILSYGELTLATCGNIKAAFKVTAVTRTDCRGLIGRPLLSFHFIAADSTVSSASPA